MNYLDRLGVWLRQILRDFPEEIVQRIMQQIADSWRPRRLTLDFEPSPYYISTRWKGWGSNDVDDIRINSPATWNTYLRRMNTHEAMIFLNHQ